MVVVNFNGQNVYLDGFLKKNLDFVQEKVLSHKNMFVCICDGRVGCGKSTLISQLAFYLNPNTSIKHETFTLEQFEEALRTAEKGDVIILDESFEVLNKRKTQSTANMLILSLLQQMRAKSVFIFIVLPSVFDLDKNIILNLCDLFIHVYRKDFGRRGQYAVYDRHRLKKLWLYCRQSYSYYTSVAKPNFRGRFTAQFPLGLEAYENKKMKALEKFAKEESIEEGNKYIHQRNQLIISMYDKKISVMDMCKTLNMTKKSIYNIINKKYKHEGDAK